LEDDRMMHTLPREEYLERQERVRAELDARDLNGLYITSPVTLYYLTGFHMVSTERPAALLVPRKGEPGFVGPRLEETHVTTEGGTIGVVRTYFDYPGDTHPMEAIGTFLSELGLGKGRVGTDSLAGSASRWGYEGPRLCDLLPRVEFELMSDFLSRQRWIKSPAEIERIRAACRWADRALELLVRRTAPGTWDVEAGLAASLDATKEMKKTLGDDFRQAVHGTAPVMAGYRGQVGARTALPHAFATPDRMRTGDVLGSGASAEIAGYHCELERTFFLGKPSEDLQHAFDVMLRAQEAAIEAMVPGAPCGDADLAAWRVFEEAGVSERTLHHSGHGIGLERHEPPFLDRGEAHRFAPGMVFAVEPGIYFPGVAGFRHSDTILVTEDGPERLTAFPRDLKACTLSGRKGKGKSQGKGERGQGKGRKKAAGGKGKSQGKGRKKATGGKGKSQGKGGRGQGKGRKKAVKKKPAKKKPAGKKR
jgi:Xaa-Pro aminopeptidase